MLTSQNEVPIPNSGKPPFKNQLARLTLGLVDWGLGSRCQNLGFGLKDGHQVQDEQTLLQSKPTGSGRALGK